MEEYQAVFRRMEVKYLLNTEALSALMPILLAHMEPDAFPHSSISNLYYDTPDFRMVRRSLESRSIRKSCACAATGCRKTAARFFRRLRKSRRVLSISAG